MKKVKVFNYLQQVASFKFREHGLQVIDLYMVLQSLISKRKEDGIHWTPEANRFVICLCYLTIMYTF